MRTQKGMTLQLNLMAEKVKRVVTCLLSLWGLWGGHEDKVKFT